MFKTVEIFRATGGRGALFKAAAALLFLCLTVAVQFVFLKNPGRMRYLFKNKPQTVHEITVQLLKNDMKIRAVAKKEDGRLKLEIFQTDGKGRKIFTKNIGRYPVFLESNGEGVFLGVLDYDGDGALDLIVSGMDSRFRPDYYILQYNKGKGRFEERRLFRSDFL